MKKLLKLALVIGGITAVSKMAAAKKAEWQGLTESEAREKLESRLPGEIPDDKRGMIIDKVVSKMSEKGVLGEEVDLTDEVDLTEAGEPVGASTSNSDSAT